MPVCFNEDSFYDFLQTGDGAFSSKKILIEGDSWTSHPQLHNLSRALDYDGNGDYAILNVSDPGATAHEMFHKDSSSLRRLHRVLAHPNYSYTFDLILLSAGGNDIIGPEIKDFITHKDTHGTSYGAELIDDETFDDALEHIVADYRLILDIIGASQANRYTPVVTHCYSNLLPRRIGTHLGDLLFNEGWVARYMEDDKGITDKGEQLDIIKSMLSRFYDALLDLQQEFYNFMVVNTLSTLSANGEPDISLFHDEIHPNLRGFKKVFRKIKSEARKYDMWIE